ncbi:MAG: hypothetical protein AB7H93_08180 [Vicinamibacterales bacterium]
MIQDSLRPSMRRGLAGALALLAVASVPYLVGFLRTPDERVYTGLLVDVPDHAQYWSWVTASRQGLFIPNTMTPEPNAAAFLNPMMWMLAQVQTLFGLSFAALFQWWRVAAALVVGPALAVITLRLSRSADQARIAFWIALAGGGLGWILVGAKYALGLADAPFPHAIYTFEPNTWFGLLGYPYLPLAQGFMCVALVGAFRVHTAPSPAAWLACALGALFVALLHAYDLVVVYAVVGAFWIVELVRGRAIPWRLSWAIVLILACSAPLAAYYQYLTSADPLWRSILTQYANAGVWTPPPPLLVILLGAPLVLAAGRLRGLDWQHPGTRFAACWALIGVVIIYVPTVFQIKLLAALQVPLAILAADLWCTRLGPAIAALTARRLGVRAASWAPACVLAALILPTNLYLVAWRLIELRRPGSDLYVTADEHAALDTLAATTGPGDVALAVESVGRWVPNQGRTRAFLAHWAMTNHYLDRRDLVARFFSAEVDDAWRQRLLADHGVTYVIWTDRGREAGGTYRPAASALFEPIHVTPTAGLFKVRQPAAPAR